jgi:hypothetical protein
MVFNAVIFTSSTIIVDIALPISKICPGTPGGIRWTKTNLVGNGTSVRSPITLGSVSFTNAVIGSFTSHGN